MSWTQPPCIVAGTMANPHDLPLLNQILEAARIVEARTSGEPHLEDPMVADGILWRITVIAQASDRLSPEVLRRHPEVDWSGVRRLHLVADGTLGGLTRDEVWRTAALVLPRLRSAVEQEVAVLGRQVGAAPKKVRRVLVVDDDPDIRRILELLLNHAGFAVVEADDGVEALERSLETHPDAVVADVQMPNMDGIELVRRLRQAPEMEQVPILLFTGKPPIDDLHGVLSMDRVRYMSKGDPQKVIAALEAMFAEAVPPPASG